MKKLLIPLLLLSLALVGCGKAKPSQQTDSPGQGAITVATYSLPPTVDPAMGVNAAVNRLHGLIGETLVDFDNQTYQFVPALAKEWSSTDSKVFTFTLRDDITFHNGKKVKAEDIKYTFERLLSPELDSYAASYLSVIEGAEDKLEGKAEEVKGIKVVSEYVIEFSLRHPQASFLAVLSYPAYSVVDKAEVDSLQDGYGSPENLISGAGKYKLVSLSDTELSLTRFDQYFGSKPQIKDLKYINLPTKKAVVDNEEVEEMDREKIAEMFNNNQLHCIITMAKIPALEQYQQELTGPGVGYFHFNHKKDLWKNKKLRQSVFYAVDKQKLASILGFEVADGFIPKAMPGYKPMNKPIYDVELAKSLLAEAGYPGGKGLPEIEIHDKPYGEPDNLLGYQIERDLEKIGIQAKVVIESNQDLTVFEESSDLMLDGWASDYPDVSSMLEPIVMSTGPSNVGKYKNDQLDSLLAEAQRETNNNRRMALYHEINNIIYDEAVNAPYGWVKKTIYVNPKLKGVRFEFNDELSIDSLWLE